MKGFTLIEVLIAMFILVIGVGGAIAFITRTISVTGDVSSRFEASYLAQEGIEIVRNLRDANFLAIRKNQCDEQTDEDCWKKNGLGGATTLANDCALGCEMQYNDTELVSFADRFLNKDSTTGFYSYGAGEATPYKRKITIIEKETEPGIFNMLEVSVEVLWSKGSVQASTELYNWLELPPSFRFNGQPTGTLPAGTISTPISLETDINAVCKYDIIANTDYDGMPSTFSTTGGTLHSETVTGLVDGDSYSYYVRCDASIGGKNFDDLVITFSIDV